MPFLRKYATATHVYVPVIKRGVVDFAVGADWTPAAGDVKVTIDGGTPANITTLPVAIAAGNGAFWDFALSAAETTGKKIVVTVVDAATKAVEDQMFDVMTYGNASAELQQDLSAAKYAATLGSGDYTGNTPQTGDAYAIVNDANFGNAKLVRSTTPANTLSVDASHAVTYNNAAPPTTAAIAAAVMSDVTDTVGADVVSILGIVSNATYGNSALHTQIAAIPTNPLTTLGTNAPAGWLNAAAFAAGALNGKGDWRTKTDGTLAAATATTITFPATDAAGNAIADDGRYQFCALEFVGGTGAGQVALLNGTTGNPREYNVQPGTMPVQPDNMTTYRLLGTWRALGESGEVLANAANQSTVSLNVSTLLSRIGAFSGSGANTVLGCFQALCRSDATLPTDLGGTYTATADSLQALRARGDTAWVTATSVVVTGGTVTTVTNPVTVGTNNDKTGYKLASDGLDTVATTVPTTGTTLDDWNFRQMIVVTAYGIAGEETIPDTVSNSGSDKLTWKKGSGSTALGTQTVTDDGTTQRKQRLVIS